MNKNILKGLVLLILIILAMVMAYPTLAQNVACYMQQGGATWVAGSGCTWNVKSGSTFQIDAGATVSIPSSVLGSSGVVRAATPVFCNRGSATITDTVAYTSTVTAISTPTWANCSMRTITGDAYNCAVSVGTPGAVSIIVRNNAATPAANAAGAAVDWVACGTAQ